MPAFDEGERLVASVTDLAATRGEASITVFVVDDGGHVPVSEEDLAKIEGIRVVLARHAVNLGQGAALETARRLALHPRFSTKSFDAFVTMDADGQHRAEDALALAAA